MDDTGIRVTDEMVRAGAGEIADIDIMAEVQHADRNRMVNEQPMFDWVVPLYRYGAPSSIGSPRRIKVVIILLI